MAALAPISALAPALRWPRTRATAAAAPKHSMEPPPNAAMNPHSSSAPNLSSAMVRNTSAGIATL